MRVCCEGLEGGWTVVEVGDYRQETVGGCRLKSEGEET